MKAGNGGIEPRGRATNKLGDRQVEAFITVARAGTAPKKKLADGGGLSLTLTAALAAAALMPEVAHAQYLHPGAASVIVQVVIAGIVGVAAFVKFNWGRISSFFTRSSKGDGPR